MSFSFCVMPITDIDAYAISLNSTGPSLPGKAALLHKGCRFAPNPVRP